MPDPIKLKITWSTEAPTRKGHERRTVAYKVLGFDTVADAEAFARLSLGFFDELVKQYNAKAVSKVIVPGAHAV